jgi:hypothetical protein
MVRVTDPYGRILCFVDRSRCFFFKVAPQLYSRGWVATFPDPVLKKSGSTRNRTLTTRPQRRSKGLEISRGLIVMIEIEVNLKIVRNIHFTNRTFGIGFFLPRCMVTVSQQLLIRGNIVCQCCYDGYNGYAATIASIVFLKINEYGFAGYVAVCVQLYCRGKRSRFLQEYESNNILHTWRWPCRPKHVV